MARQRLKRGDLVTYRAITMTFSAIVRHVHRDGSITVEALHELRNGTPIGCYIGERVRLEAKEVWADLGGSARLPTIGKMPRFQQ